MARHLLFVSAILSTAILAVEFDIDFMLRTTDCKRRFFSREVLVSNRSV